jgi:acetoacetate decarboxylase
MPITRYFKTAEQLSKSTSQNQDVTESLVTNVVIEYKTNPEALAECLPPHFQPNPEGLVRLTLSNVDVQLGAINFEFGAVALTLGCTLDGEEGGYCLHMYMNQETPVVAGREIYGEPKKIADIDFQKNDDSITCNVTRQFMPIIGFKGNITGPALPTTVNRQTMFVHKAFPAIDGSGFEYPPRLNRLQIETAQKELYKMEGELVLSDSPLDPIADLPVHEIVSIHCEIGTSRSNGEFIREVPAEELAPYFHSRNDDLDALLGG